MKVSYDQLFAVNGNMATTKVPVRIEMDGMSAQFGPGQSFAIGGGASVSFGGVNLATFIGKDLEIEVDHVNKVNIIRGVYQ